MIVFTIPFIFTFFVTQFAASRVKRLYPSLIHNTLPQHSLVLFFFCFIFINAALCFTSIRHAATMQLYNYLCTAMIYRVYKPIQLVVVL